MKVELVDIAARRLSAGDLVAFPTETVYGLGANACDSVAVSKIFALKGRPANNPLIVHIANAARALELAATAIDSKIRTRLEKLTQLWPGPLSLIIPKPDHISELVSAGGPTIAIRVPDHPLALELLKAVNFPLAAPSANKSFAVSPTTAQHVRDSFPESDLLIIDGGSCKVGLESTVLDICASIPTILRPGAIGSQQIADLLNEEILGNPSAAGERTGPLASPGLFEKHYSPGTRLAFLDELTRKDLSSNSGILLMSARLKQELQQISKHVIVLSQNQDLHQVAKTLYSAIRELDKLGLDLIAVEKCQETGIGSAIMDRLRRAACR